MKQLTIYDVLGYIDDPVYQKLLLLKNNHMIEIEGICVERGQFGWYEVSNHEIHECFKNLDECYIRINELISPALNRVSF
jgi:hypothetical protein